MSEHIESKKTYLLVFAALLVLTGVTSGVAYIDLGPFSVVVALAIAVIKMLLVAHIFATAILLARMDIKTAEDERKRRRRLAGMAASGLVVILISAFLRRIF